MASSPGALETPRGALWEPRAHQHGAQEVPTPWSGCRGRIHSPAVGNRGEHLPVCRVHLRTTRCAVHLSQAGIRAEHLPWWDLTHWEGFPELQFCLVQALSHCSQLPLAISHIFQLCFVKNSFFPPLQLFSIQFYWQLLTPSTLQAFCQNCLSACGLFIPQHLSVENVSLLFVFVSPSTIFYS